MSRAQVLLSLIDGSLSDAERRQVLAAALLSLDAVGLERLYTRLAQDTSTTLRTLLARLDGDRTAAPQPSIHRLEQEWRQAWSTWDDIIDASSDEEGEFIEQEAHWEAPYLDVYTIGKRLEAVAERLLPIADRVLSDGLEPDFELMDRVDDDIRAIGAGLPEWFGEHHFDGLLGPKLTALVLRWQRLSALEGATGHTVLEAVRLAEADSDRWSLDDEALLAFVHSMSDDHQRELFGGIAEKRNEPHWASVLTSTWSPWFTINRLLAQRWDPAAELAICRAGIASDWSLAIPVLEDILERHALDEAEPVIEEALATLLRLRGEERWDPLRGLLVDHRALRYRHRPATQLPALLRLCGRLAACRGEDELASSWEAQAVLYECWHEWDAVLDYLATLRADQKPRLASHFFELWSAMLVQRSSRHRYGEDLSPDKSWVPLLARAAWEGTSPDLTLSKLSGWLDDAASSPESFGIARPWLAVLTQDVGLDGAASTLLELLGDQCSRDAPSRRAQLRRVGVGGLASKLLATWSRNAVELVPDPRDNRKSSYGPHAAWLEAVHELSATAYARVVADWRRDHGRRRNLWKAIRGRGLPV